MLDLAVQMLAVEGLTSVYLALLDGHQGALAADFGAKQLHKDLAHQLQRIFRGSKTYSRYKFLTQYAPQTGIKSPSGVDLVQ